MHVFTLTGRMRLFWPMMGIVAGALALAGCGEHAEVSFSGGGGGLDQTPPFVSGTTPAADATDTSPDLAAVTATFDDFLLCSRVDKTSYK